jgi:isocitrate dehydrogenase (NAD+)
VAKRTIVSMPGDGIGKVVLPEAIRVLEAAGFEADYVHADIGWEFWIKEGNPLPQRTIELLDQHKIGLFGAITSKPKEQAAAELDPSLRDKGFVYYSPIVGLRQRFNLDVSHPALHLVQGQPAELRPQGRRHRRGAARRRGHLPPEHRGALRRRRVDESAGTRFTRR